MNIEKLPKWAQEHIDTLERQRDAAVGQLRKFTDEQTPARIWIEDSACTGEERGPTTRKRYVDGHFLEIEHAGVHVSITLAEGEIRFSYGAKQYSISPMWLLPSGWQQFAIKPFPEKEQR